MNKNEIYSWIQNPFTRIAGWQAFVLGAVINILIGITGTYANVYFDGAIDMHFTENANFRTSINCLIVDLLSLVLTLSVAGIFVAKNFRLLDILGTVSLAKAPFLLLAITALAVDAPSAEQLMRDPSSAFSSLSFIIIMILTLPVYIWHILLLFNAYKTSTGAKGGKVVPSFIIALLVAEIISKLVITSIL